jgi:Zn-dependent peptidase ImmA (M78 family)
MNIDNDYPIPSVEIVSKERLNEIFATAFDESYKKIEEQMGQVEAKKIMEFYLEEVIGLFIPETKAIYVNNIDDNGIRESIIAHEIAHYLQDIVDGFIDSGEYMADQKRLYREMQAGDIENKYLKTFYGDK